MAACFHNLEGRLRIKLPDIKGSTQGAREVARRMRSIPGVERATANPLTGSLLVLYDSARTHAPELFDALRAWGYLHGAVLWSSPHADGDRLAAAMVRTTTQLALQGLFGALIQSSPSVGGRSGATHPGTSPTAPRAAARCRELPPGPARRDGWRRH